MLSTFVIFHAVLFVLAVPQRDPEKATSEADGS